MLVYIATPFTHASATVRAENFARANRFAAYAMMQGHTVFSPISHSVPIAEYLPPELLCDFDFWMAADLPILRKCDALWVCPPDAYKTSRGVAREIAEAADCGIPVCYVEEKEIENGHK